MRASYPVAQTNVTSPTRSSDSGTAVCICPADLCVDFVSESIYWSLDIIVHNIGWGTGAVDITLNSALDITLVPFVFQLADSSTMQYIIKLKESHTGATSSGSISTDESARLAGSGFATRSVSATGAAMDWGNIRRARKPMRRRENCIFGIEKGVTVRAV